jgi:hypothetical protein
MYLDERLAAALALQRQQHQVAVAIGGVFPEDELRAVRTDGVRYLIVATIRDPFDRPGTIRGLPVDISCSDAFGTRSRRIEDESPAIRCPCT